MAVDELSRTVDRIDIATRALRDASKIPQPGNYSRDTDHPPAIIIADRSVDLMLICGFLLGCVVTATGFLVLGI